MLHLIPKSCEFGARLCSSRVPFLKRESEIGLQSEMQKLKTTTEPPELTEPLRVFDMHREKAVCLCAMLAMLTGLQGGKHTS